MNFEWLDHPNTVSVFIYLIVKANYSDQEWHGLFIKRGQLLTSRAKLAKRLGMSEMEVRTALKHLISTGQITVKSTKQGTLVTVEKYEKRQASTRKSNQQKTDILTDLQPTYNQPATKNKKDKERQEGDINTTTKKTVAEILTESDYDVLEEAYGEEHLCEIIDRAEDAFRGRDVSELAHPLQYCMKLADGFLERRAL